MQMLRQSIHNPSITTINFCTFFFFLLTHICIFTKPRDHTGFVTCLLPLGVSATTFLFRKDVPIYSSTRSCESNPIPLTPLALSSFSLLFASLKATYHCFNLHCFTSEVKHLFSCGSLPWDFTLSVY